MKKMQKGFIWSLVLIGLGLPILGGVGGYLLFNKLTLSIKPTQQACTLEAKICPDGISVERVGPNCEFAKCPTLKTTASPSPELTPSEIRVVSDGCEVAGCSRQLCVDKETAEDIRTTCEWREEYACYKTARCEKQSDGKCDWTKAEELNKCLQEKRNVPSNKLQ